MVSQPSSKVSAGHHGRGRRAVRSLVNEVVPHGVDALLEQLDGTPAVAERVMRQCTAHSRLREETDVAEALGDGQRALADLETLERVAYGPVANHDRREDDGQAPRVVQSLGHGEGVAEAVAHLSVLAQSHERG